MLTEASAGNVNYAEWYDGAYTTFLDDADKVMSAFFDFCHLAGPDRCAFYSPTPSQIRDRLDALLARLRITPVLIPASPSGPTLPELVTYSRVRRMLSTALYQPILRFSRVAAVLAGLESGNGTAFYEYTSPEMPSHSSSTLCVAETHSPLVPLPGYPSEGNPSAFPAIMCSDAEPFNSTLEEFAAYAEQLQERSPAVGAVQLEFRLACVGRKIRPKWRPDFKAMFGDNQGVRTSFPILFVNNLADNVTPLISAQNDSRVFEDSVVLVQNSWGHTTLAAPSECTARWINRYFQEGVLPPEGTVCEGDWAPFEEANTGGESERAARNSDEDVIDDVKIAVKNLARRQRV